MGKTILIVEDEQNIVDILSFNLSREGYDTLEAYDGPAGLQLALENDPDLILLDLMLPGMDGFEVCRKVRESGSAAPIIMLTAREEEADKVLGLELGADDYITKPFRLRELVSRIRSVLRRCGRTEAGNVYTFGSVQINTAQGKVYKEGRDVFLTALEYRLLLSLVNNEGRILSRNQLLESIWDVSGDFVNENTLTVYIKRLREKIEDDPQNPVIIQTVRGLGYRIGKGE